MKTKATQLFLMFSLLCLGMTGAAHADNRGIGDHTVVDESLPVYARKLTSIITEENSEEGKCIKLDDGSVWLVKGYEHGGEKHLKTWAKGDRILFMWNSKTQDGYYVAYNLEKHGQPKVILDPNTLGGFPVISNIADKGSQITLSDGSVWNVTWWGRMSTKKWKIGQHVLIQGDGYSNNYSLTNLDTSGKLFNNHKIANVEFVEYMQQ
ncbi:MAG: hypothetical protein LLG04_01515 [Parachlamydia sp.]|nr:hypothetical protein [Parachlamydia sp.]